MKTLELVCASSGSDPPLALFFLKKMAKLGKKRSGPNLKDMSKQRRASIAPTSSYCTYVGKIQKQMFAGKNVAISKGSVLSLNQMAVYLVDRLAVEAARAARYAKSSTLNMKAGSTANRLVLRGQLGNECDVFASQAVLNAIESAKATAEAAPAASDSKKADKKKKKKKKESAESEDDTGAEADAEAASVEA